MKSEKNTHTSLADSTPAHAQATPGVSDQKDLLKMACRDSDESAVRRLGWGAIYDTLRLGWNKRFVLTDLEAYVSMLHDYQPSAIEAALAEAATTSEYHPAPAALAFALAAQGRESGPSAPKPPAGGPRTTRPRPDQTREAYQAVLEAVAAGEVICECVPRPADVIADYWHVLRCPDCDGLEVGQYEAAMEAAS